MKRFDIDFAGEGGAWRWDWQMPGTRLFIALAALALLFGAAVMQRAWQIERELAQTRLASADLQRERERMALAERDRLRLGAEDELLLRQSAQLRALPWESIFSAFENAPPVRLQAFEPDPARGVVKVQATMPDVAAMQAYVHALEASPVFRRVNLLRHEVAAEGGGVNAHLEAILAAPYRLPEPDQRRTP